MKSILLIEDEVDLRNLIQLHLKREGWSVKAFDTAEAGIIALKQGYFDLIVVDWMLPGMSGLEVCKSNLGKIPVLMVTARAEIIDIVLGLESGADDYLTKPFDVQVLTARCRALLRRGQLLKESQSFPFSKDMSEETPIKRNLKRFGEIEFDQASYSLKVKGEEIFLTPSEFKLLGALLKNAGRVLTRDRLIELVQGEGVSVIDRAIDTHVFGLRKKLGAAADLIETIRGIGYRIKADET